MTRLTIPPNNGASNLEDLHIFNVATCGIPAIIVIIIIVFSTHKRNTKQNADGGGGCRSRSGDNASESP